jgi:hypothetical protein
MTTTDVTFIGQPYLVVHCHRTFQIMWLMYAVSAYGADIDLVATITGDQLNTRDQQRLVKGYYEEMLGVEGSGAMAWSVLLEQPDDWNWNGESRNTYGVATGDIRGRVFRPGISGTHKGRALLTNQWGLRGPEFEKSKPPGTYRIATDHREIYVVQSLGE